MGCFKVTTSASPRPTQPSSGGVPSETSEPSYNFDLATILAFKEVIHDYSCFVLIFEWATSLYQVSVSGKQPASYIEKIGGSSHHM